MRKATALVAVGVSSVALAGSLLAHADSTAAYDAVAATAPLAMVVGNLFASTDNSGWGLPSTVGVTRPRGTAAAVSFLDSGSHGVERTAGTPVAAGQVYTGSFASRGTSSGTPVTALLSWYDGQGRHLTGDDVRSATATDNKDGWTRYQVAGLSPPTAVTVRLAASYDDAQAGATHFLSGSSLTAREQGSADLLGPLATRGTSIVDRAGRTVVLRGLNRAGQWDTAQPGGLDARDLARIKAWGGNVVRLTLGQHKWLPGCASYDPGYRAAIARTVRMVNDLGMLAVLDLHFTAPTCATAGANPMPDRGSLQFWQQVARAYKNAPLVAFDLYNEPYGVSAAVWRDGGAARTDHGVSYRAVGLRPLYDAVRATGAKNLVLVSGLDRAAAVPGNAWFTGTNVVWSLHTYVCSLPWLCRSTDTSARLRTFDPIARQLPVIVSEFGHPSGQSRDGTTFNAGVIAYAESHHWSWAAWAWDVDGTCKQRQYFNLLSSTACGTGTGTFQPSPAAIPILVGLGRNS